MANNNNDIPAIPDESDIFLDDVPAPDFPTIEDARRGVSAMRHGSRFTISHSTEASVDTNPKTGKHVVSIRPKTNTAGIDQKPNIPPPPSEEEMFPVGPNLAEQASSVVKGLVPHSPTDLLKTTAGASVGLPAAVTTVEKFKALPAETQDKLLKSIAPTAASVAIPALLPAIEAPAGAGLGLRAAALLGRTAENAVGAGGIQATEEAQNAALDKKVPEGAGKRILDTAKTGAAFSAGIEAGLGTISAVGTALKGLHRSAVGVWKGTNGRVIDRVFDAAKNAPDSVKEAAAEFFTAIGARRAQASAASAAASTKMFDALGAERNAASAQLGAAKSLPIGGLDHAQIADKAAELANTLRKESIAITEKASQHLTDVQDIPNTKLLVPLENAKNSLRVRGGIVGDASKEAASALDRWAEDIKSITTKIEPGVRMPGDIEIPGVSPAPKVTNMPVSEQDVKQLVQKMDGDVVWEKVKGQPEQEKLLKSVRGTWKGLLERNDIYRKEIAPVHDLIKGSDEFEKALALKTVRDESGLTVVADDASRLRAKSLFSGDKIADIKSAEAGGRFSKELLAGQKNVADTAAKEEAVKIAESRLAKPNPVTPGIEGAKVSLKKAAQRTSEPVPTLDEIQKMAEAAANGGTHSPAMNKLVAVVAKVLPGRGASAAEDLATAAAKGMFARGRSKTSASITANLVNTLANTTESVSPGIAGGLDKILKAVQSVKGASTALPTRTAGALLSKSLSEQGK